MKERSRANIEENSRAAVSWLEVIGVIALATIGILVSDAGDPDVDWAFGRWAAVWLVGGALAGLRWKLLPLVILLSVAVLTQAAYYALFADRGEGDGLWVVGFFIIPVGGVLSYGAATVAAFVRHDALGRSSKG